MSKEELLHELTDINLSFVNDINAKLTDLSEMFNDFTSEYDKVYSELQHWENFNSHLLTMISPRLFSWRAQCCFEFSAQ